MRASRAYIAGFGTSSVLVGATLLLFLVVSALVAFKTWPESGLADAVSDLVVREESRALTVDGPTQVALDAASAAAAVGAADVPLPTAGAVAAGAPASGIAPGGPPPARGNPQTVTGLGPVTQSPSPGPSSPPSSQGGGGAQGGSPTSGVGGVTNGLGDTSQGLTDNLGGTVGGVSPELGKTVTDTGEALSDLVRGLEGP